MPCTFGVDILGATVCFDGVVDGIVNSITDSVLGPIENAFNEYIVQPISNFFSGLLNDIESGLRSLAGTLETALGTAASDIEAFLSHTGSAIENALSMVWNALTNDVTELGDALMDALNDVSSAVVSGLGDLGSQVSNWFVNMGQTLSEGLSGVESFVSSSLGSIGNDIMGMVNGVFSSLSGALGSLGHDLMGGIAAVAQGAENALTAVQSLGSAIEGDLSGVADVFAKGLEAFATDAYNVLKDVVNLILQGLDAVASSVENFGRNTINSILSLIKPRGREDVTSVISEVEDAALMGAGAYMGITGAVKVLENLHPFHELNIQEYTDKIMEMFAVDAIPSKFIEGVFAMGLFTQMEYALNYMMRPHITDRGTEERAVWYGLETPDEYAQSLALEGMSSDLIEKATGVLYRPMSPFILRYLVETGLADQNFLTQQLAMEGFSPSDAAKTASIFGALELAPFQSQIKSVIYTYYKAGLMSEVTATQIMNVFQIPETQQQWILHTAEMDFKLEQKQQLGQVALDLVEKGEVSVEQAINMLVAIGYQPDRAKVMAEIRGITSGPPPPKSTRALILQDALKNLSAIGLS